jgi:triacylglycerol esterase/lipase EstA (alpha/beta hydrolase family)
MSLQGIAGWVAEGLALLLSLVVWPLGLFPDRRVAAGGGDRPVVLVHGWAMNRSSMFVLAARLRRDGRRVYSVNYNSVVAKTDDKASELAACLETIRRDSGANRIDLVAHSLGGVLLRAVAKYHGGLDYFGNVVTLGSPHRGTALAVMYIVFPTDCTFYPPAFNAELDGIGHMGMLLSERVYDVVKENLDADLPS